jgi:hypothetical protein
MDRIELEDTGFPYSAQTLRFMQEAFTRPLADLCKAHGSNFIAWGCDVSGGSITAGAIVVDGELLPFEAGVYNAKFKIEESSTNVVYEDQVQRSAYFTRKAVCSAGGAYTLADFPRLRVPRKYVETDWTTVPFYDSVGTWEDAGEALTPSGLVKGATANNVLKARITQDGMVMLSGGGRHRSDLYSNPAPFEYAVLPEKFRPSGIRYVPVTGHGSYNGNDYVVHGYAWIYPSGSVNLPDVFCGDGNIMIAPFFNCLFNLD